MPLTFTDRRPCMCVCGAWELDVPNNQLCLGSPVALAFGDDERPRRSGGEKRSSSLARTSLSRQKSSYEIVVVVGKTRRIIKRALE